MINPIHDQFNFLAKWWRRTVVAIDHATVAVHQCSIGFVLWSVRSWFKTGKAWTGRPGNGGLWRITLSTSWDSVRWITWCQVTSDEDAWRPLIRYGIRLCIVWFGGDIVYILWNTLALEYMKFIILPAFFGGSCISKKKENAKCKVLSDCMWPGSCRWQPTTCLRWKNGKHMTCSIF